MKKNSLPTPFAFLFDHDGTLVDSEALHFQCWQQVMHEYGYQLTEQEYIRDHNGVPTSKNAQNLVMAAGIAMSTSCVAANELAEKKRCLFAQKASEKAPPLLPTVREALAVTHRFAIPAAIVTGAGDDDIARSMLAHKLGSYFQAVATNSQVKHGKPAPDVYLLACEKLGVSPTDAYAFEDTAAGIASAKAAGVYCVAIPNKYSLHQDLSGADTQCETLLQAVNHCRRIATERQYDSNGAC